MKKSIAVIAAIIMILAVTSQASAQVATFNSLSLHFSNTILTTAQYQQVLEGPKTNADALQLNDPATKHHLAAAPAVTYVFGDNTNSEQVNILEKPLMASEPTMAAALDKWINKETALQQPKRRTKR